MKQGLRSLLYSFSTCPSPNHLNLCRRLQAQPNIRPTPCCLSYQRPSSIFKGILTVDPVLAVVKVSGVNTIRSSNHSPLMWRVHASMPPLARANFSATNTLCMYVCNVMCTIITIHVHVRLPSLARASSAHASREQALPTFSSFHAG